MSDDDAFPWHRVFHPLCGADPMTLARLVVRRGLPSPTRLPTFAVACAVSLARLPFTLTERALDGATRPPRHPPIFVVGHPRSGTTHLHNVLAASDAFTLVPPVIAALPWERRTFGPLMRPFVEPRLPATRLIDGVKMRGDAPTEDEVALANTASLSYFHALYFPRGFADDYREGLLHLGPPARQAQRLRAISWYVTSMSRRGRAPLLLKNPAYTARVDLLLRLFPGARVIHIHRDPASVFASTRRTLRTVLTELALQDFSHVDVDEVVLDTYPRLMAGLRETSARVAPDAFAEVAFEDLVSTPAPVLRRLWRQLELPGGDEALTKAATYCDGLSGYRPSPNRLTRAEVEMLRVRWPDDLALYGRLTAADGG
jgi:omega-hydroxy-beta-dihydromenaquinone-9 sulfotransferase